MTKTTSQDATTTAEIDGRLFQALRVRGFADDQALADATGLDSTVVSERLAAAEASGEIKQLNGRISGVRLTLAGEEHRQTLLNERPVKKDRLESAYEGFLEPNLAFKELVTSWQTGARDGAAESLVLQQLTALDTDAQTVVANAAAADPRFARYGIRLAAALDRVKGGDLDAVARPMTGSYHDVWMEFHEDLLCTLGRLRSAADGD